MYETPGSYIRHVVIDSKVVAEEKAPIYLGADQAEFAKELIAEDDGNAEDRQETTAVRQQMTQV